MNQLIIVPGLELRVTMVMLILRWSNRNSHLILRKWICNKGWRGKWFHKNNFKFLLVAKTKNYLKNCPSQNLQSEKTWVYPADQNWVRFKFLWGGEKMTIYIDPSFILQDFYWVLTQLMPGTVQGARDANGRRYSCHFYSPRIHFSLSWWQHLDFPLGKHSFRILGSCGSFKRD